MCWDVLYSAESLAERIICKDPETGGPSLMRDSQKSRAAGPGKEFGCRSVMHGVCPVQGVKEKSV